LRRPRACRPGRLPQDGLGHPRPRYSVRFVVLVQCYCRLAHRRRQFADPWAWGGRRRCTPCAPAPQRCTSWSDESVTSRPQGRSVATEADV
jgi:hypothetical protein